MPEWLCWGLLGLVVLPFLVVAAASVIILLWAGAWFALREVRSLAERLR